MRQRHSIGGPVGAIGGVLIVGTVELTSAWIDGLYAKAEGKRLDHKLHMIWVGTAYAEILGRLPDKAELEKDTALADESPNLDLLRAKILGRAEASDLIIKIFQHHVGRPPAFDECKAWVVGLVRSGVSTRSLEIALATSPEAIEFAKTRAVRP